MQKLFNFPLLKKLQQLLAIENVSVKFQRGIY